MAGDGSDSDDDRRHRAPSSSSSSSSSSSDSSGEEERVAGPSISAAAEEEDPNSGYVEPESPGSNVSRASSSSEGVLVERPLNNDQDSRFSQGEPDSGILVNIDGSMQEGDRDGEDPAREETFVDASDQLGFAEGRGGASRGLGESLTVFEVGEGARVEEIASECRKYKEEREVFGREVVGLRRKLQAMFKRLSGRVAGDDGKEEEGGEDSRDLMSPTPLHAMLRDCSEFASHLEGSLDKQLQSDDNVRELRALVCYKDREIEELNVKVLESSMSHDIVVSYLGSLRETWLESSRQSSAAAAKRLLASLASVGPQDDDSLEDSAVEGISLVEKKTALLAEKYAQILSEVEQLGRSLAAIKSDFVMPQSQQKELGIVFDAACQALLEGKSKESDFLSMINELKKEKGEVADQLDRTRESLEEAKADANKNNSELEQAENKLAATKEKLSMAVTKGKSLVQHRDSLKQSLAEKTGELEKCLQELQHKSDALEASEARIEELNKSQDLVLSLQDSLSHKDKVLQEIEEVTSQVDLPSQTMEVIDMVRWLVAQKQISEGILLVNNKLKDALSSFDLPESISATDLEYQISWLGKSFAQNRDDLIKLQGELTSMQAAAAACELELLEARKEVEHLSATVLIENQEKDSLQVVHEDLMHKYEEVIEKLSRVSSEKNRLTMLLVETSEGTVDYRPHGEIDAFVEECIGKFRERKKSSLETSLVVAEQFQKTQSLFYVSNLELMLSKEMLEEEILDRAEVMNLSNELQRASEEVISLRNERDNLQKDLERVEERSSLLREKLSMAVKKGKGLVQEREGFKLSLDEKNSEIEKLKHEVQQQESTVVELKEQIKILCTDLERIQVLESDIVSTREERDQIEHFLLESNTALQRVIHSIECIVFPTDITFKDSVEKVKWIAEHIHEYEANKVQAVQELEKAREQAVVQATELADAYATIKSLQDSLSHAENHISVIAEEKNDAQFGQTSAEQELEKIKEEADDLEKKLSDSYTTIKNLEDALSQAQNNISILTSEKNEIESKSKQDIVSLNSRLTACVEELAGTSGSLENQSVELVSHLKHLQMLTKDVDLLFVMAEGFRKKNDGLKDMAILIQNMHDLFAAKELRMLPSSERDPGEGKPFSLPQFEDFVNDRAVASEISKADLDDDIPSFTKVFEGFSSQTKLLRDRFSYFSGCMDDHIALLLQALQATKNEVVGILDHREILELSMKNLETSNGDQENKISTLQNSMSSLISACNSATQDLQIDFLDILDVEFISEEEKFSSNLLPESREAGGDEKEEHGERNSANEYAAAAESLLVAVRRVKTQTQQSANAKNMWDMVIGDLRNKFRESELAAETARQDRNLSHERVLKLEGDIEVLQNICNDLKFKMEDYEAKEQVLRDKEDELFSLHQKLSAKDKEEHEKLFLEGQLESIFDKVNKMEVSFKELKEGNKEPYFPSPIDKLFYIIDNVSELQHMLNALINEKEDMQSVLAEHVNEIEHHKKVSESFNSNNQELENKRNDLFELALALEKIIQRLGGNELAEHKKPSDAKALLPVLERLVIASNMETENFKSRAQELGAKLQATQMVVEELTSKVTLLEGSIQVRPTLSDNKERNIFEPSSSSITGSEISEIEDMGPLGKNSVSSVPAAAHVRTMRKGSNEHLTLNIDLESDRLISPHETDDKGHVFKSLNTSGFIPKQGKMIADRIDGIWVSGGRILMSRPGARMGLIAYCLLLHMWVLATVL